MKFSILIANYNNGRYFANCYNSILAQTHENWEVIISDDGSTDDSVSLIENLIRDDDHFLFSINDSNKGCGSVQDLKKIKEIYNSKYFFNCPIQMNAFFTFLKEAYDKTEGINPNLQSAVDQDLYLKVLEQGKVSFIRKNLYLYRHAKGISQDKSKPKARESFAKVIFDTFNRRNIKKINGKNVPESYPGAHAIFDMLNYQNSIKYRMMLKIILKEIF